MNDLPRGAWHRLLAASTLVLASLLLPSPGHAQSAGAFAGWIGLMTTPVGGFAPAPFVPESPGATGGVDVRARYGHWQFDEDDDNTTNLGLGVGLPMGRGRFGLEVGRSSVKDCDGCGAWMFGIDADIPVVHGGSADQASVIVALNPELGYRASTDRSDATTLGAALNVPVSLVAPLGGQIRAAPFVAPGVGFGRISGNGASESGARFILGGGLTVASPSNRLRATAAVSKVFFDEGVSVFGIGLSVSD